MDLAHEHNLGCQLTVAERQLGQTGKQAYDRFKPQIDDMKEAAARQGQEAARTKLAAKEKRLAQKKGKNVVREMVEEEDAEVDAEEGRPIMRSIRVRGARKFAPRVPVDADAESAAMPANSLSRSKGKKHTPAPTPPLQSSAANTVLRSKANSTVTTLTPADLDKLSHQGPIPGPSGTRKAHVDIEPKRKRKRKHTPLEPDANDSGRDNLSDAGDEGSYVAGRISGLKTFVTMLEAALGSLKKEVEAINEHMERKRRRR